MGTWPMISRPSSTAEPRLSQRPSSFDRTLGSAISINYLVSFFLHASDNSLETAICSIESVDGAVWGAAGRAAFDCEDRLDTTLPFSGYLLLVVHSQTTKSYIHCYS